MAHIVLVDDETNFATATAEFFRIHGHSVVTADCLSAARSALERKMPDLLLLDLMLPDGNGLDLLQDLQDERPRLVVVITGHPAIKGTIRELGGPSVAYLTKPVDSSELRRLASRLDAVDAADADDTATRHFGLLVGESPSMHAVYQAIRQVAPTDTTVMILGESGTGKELVAEAIHRHSGRSGAFVPVNCGALTRDLVASELFGHEKGSFTGASRRHSGVFERAREGTLFLDEITEMPMEQQPHLLRVIESRHVVRVGGEELVGVNARLVVATNRDPHEAIREKQLREDLYYRLSVYPIQLPPLRERPDDVALLAKSIVDELNRKHATRKVLDEAALDRLKRYSWPGNVRELRHTVHRGFIGTADPEGAIDVAEPLETPMLSRPGIQPGRSIRDVERDLILMTLKHFGGNKRATADTLGISLKTLYNRLNEYSDDTEEETT
jgi:DNA-binding NtrC family response regulator